jgi:hypothetical protein
MISGQGRRASRGMLDRRVVYVSGLSLGRSLAIAVATAFLRMHPDVVNIAI